MSHSAHSKLLRNAERVRNSTFEEKLVHCQFHLELMRETVRTVLSSVHCIIWSLWIIADDNCIIWSLWIIADDNCIIWSLWIIADDNCKKGLLKCAQNCHFNKCHCNPGYTLNSDGLNCDGKYWDRLPLSKPLMTYTVSLKRWRPVVFCQSATCESL